MASNALRFLDLSEANGSPFVGTGCQITDKSTGIRQYVAYMLDRTNSMFEYTGLPDTIPAYMLETYLQVFGYAAFTEVDASWYTDVPSDSDKSPGLHIFFGGIGGYRDIYYRPKTFIVSNPRLNCSVNCTILYDKETEGENKCVLMKSDTNYMGLLPLFNRYATQMVENDISIRSAQINARAQIGISVSTDGEAESARKYLDDLEAGKLAVIGKSAFLEALSISNVSTQSANVIIQLIELQQYLKASWYNEIGLNVNFNMKREYMSEQEIAVNTDVLLPLVDDMLRCRKEAVEQINNIFGTNITVEKSSAWANKNQEVYTELQMAANEAGIDLPGTVTGGDESAKTQKVDTEDGTARQAPDEVEVQSTGNPGSDLDGQQTDAGNVNPESQGGPGEQMVEAIAEIVEEVIDNAVQSEEPKESDTV